MPARKLLLLSPALVVAALLLALRVSPGPPTVLAAPPADLAAAADPSAPAPERAAVRDEPDRVRAAAPAAAPAVSASPPGAPAAKSAAPAVRARVVDAGTGDPVRGARVAWSQGERSGTGSTDADGALGLPLDLLGPRVELRVDSQGYVALERTVEVERELELQLRAPARLSGRVLAADTGVPVAGARLVVRSPGTRAESASDARGAYALEGVPRGAPLRVEVVADGFPARAFRLRIEAGAAEARRDLELVHGLRFRGRVVDRDTGAPIPDATLTSGWIESDVRTADASGAFDLEYRADPRAGAPWVRVDAPGHCSLVVHLPDEPRADVALPLVRPGWIEGVVRDERGAPVPGAKVTFLGLRRAGTVSPAREGDAPWPRPWRYATPELEAVTADSDGRFRSPPIPRAGPRTAAGAKSASGECRLRVEAPGFVRGDATARVPATDETVAVEVELARAPAAASVRGTVTLNGVPCPGALQWKAGGERGRVQVPHGELALDDLPPGPATFTFLPFGRVRGAAERVGGLRRELELAAGREARLDLELVSPLGEVRGRVATLGGEALAGERVVAALGDAAYETRSDASGTYWLELPDLGEPWTLVCRPGAQQERRTGVAPGAVVDFVFPTYADVRVRARDARTGVAVEGLRIAWTPAGDAGSPARFGAPRDVRVTGPHTDGWSTAGLPVGRVDLRVEARGYLATTLRDVDVFGRGATPELEVDLARWATVDVALADGVPPLPRGTFLFLVEEERWPELRFDPRPGGPVPTFDGRDENDAARRAVRLGADGRARVSGVGEGVLRFKTIGADVVIEPAVVVLPRVEPGPVRVRWSWRDRRGAR